VVRQVNLEGRHGHVAHRGGMEIGALGIVHGGTSGTDPVHGFPRGLVCWMTFSAAWRLPERHSLRLPIWAYGRLGILTLSNHGCVPTRCWRCMDSTSSRALRAALCNSTQSRSTWEKAMAGTPNKKPSMAAPTGAGVDGVIAHVGAVVDARYHQVRPVIQQARQGNVHAVCGCAVDVAKTVGRPVHVQGECSVSALDLALLLCSGATTSTSATSLSASYKATIPAAWYPSSLEIRIFMVEKGC